MQNQLTAGIVNGQRRIRTAEPIRVVNVEGYRNESIFVIKDIRLDLLAEHVDLVDVHILQTNISINRVDIADLTGNNQ